ncbi:MAG: hypothetical protein QXP88_00095 [Thermoproteota archaeon]
MVIVATKYNNTAEAEEVFNQRNSVPVQGRSTVQEVKKLIERKKHSTPLINLDWEWVEYE